MTNMNDRHFSCGHVRPFSMSFHDRALTVPKAAPMQQAFRSSIGADFAKQKEMKEQGRATTSVFEGTGRGFPFCTFVDSKHRPSLVPAHVESRDRDGLGAYYAPILYTNLRPDGIESWPWFCF